MGNIFSEGKNSIFWQEIGFLPGRRLFNKEYNIVPYFVDKPLLFVDYFPDLFDPLTDTYLRVVLNKNEIKRVKIVDYLGKIYVELNLAYGTNTVEVKSDDLLTVYKTYVFVTQNTNFPMEVLGNFSKDLYVDNEKIKNDLFAITVRDEQIYDNFGFLFDFKKPIDISYQDYRDQLLGSDTLPGIRKAYFESPTIQAIKDAVKSLTGVNPIIETYLNLYSMLIFDNSIDSDPDHSYIDNDNPVYLLDDRYKRFAVLLKIFSALRNIKNELVSMTAVNGSNYLLNNNLTSGIITIKDLNLLTKNQSNVETNTVGFGSTGAIISRTNLDKYKGNYSLLTTVSASDSGARILTIPMEVGYFIASVYIKMKTKPVNFQGLKMKLYDNDGFSLIAEKNLLPQDLSVNEFRRFSIIGYFRSGTFAEWEIFTKQPDLIEFYSDAFQVEYGTQLHNWQDPGSVSGIYIENTDFTVDRTNGIITWIGTQPNLGSIYLVNYDYIIEDLIKSVIDNIKPAHILVEYEFL